MTQAFIDTSALAKRYVPEEGSDAFDSWLAGVVPAVISQLALVEMGSLVRRRVREGHLSGAEAADVELALDHDVEAGVLLVVAVAPSALHVARRLLGAYAHHGLRTLDAVQLACALESGASRFASADGRLCGAAEEAGLAVQRFGRAVQAQ